MPMIKHGERKGVNVKNFGLGVFTENGEFKECSPEFLESIDKIPFAEVNFDISNIESHHPPIYLGVNLTAELDVEVVEVNKKAWEELKMKNKAYEETAKTLAEIHEAFSAASMALMETPEFKDYDEAWEALEEAKKAVEKAKKTAEGTPEYKDFKEAVGAKRTWKEAREAMWATPEDKDYMKAWAKYGEAWWAWKEAKKAMEATPEWKDYLKAWEAMKATPEWKAFEEKLKNEK